MAITGEKLCAGKPNISSDSNFGGRWFHSGLALTSTYGKNSHCHKDHVVLRACSDVDVEAY